MIIGIDAGALSVTDERLKVGVWHVTYNLLKELSKIDKKNAYRLYTFLPIDSEMVKSFGPRMTNIIVRPRFGWATIQLPIELRRHPVDTFLGLSQMLPYTSTRSIGFVYDLGFLHYPDAYPGSVNRLKNQTKQLIKRADRIITISEVSKNDIVSAYGINGDNVAVSYPGVDKQFVSEGNKHKEESPYILMVGALKRSKNIAQALRIFKRFITESKKQYKLVIVGGNYWEDPEINKVVKDLGLEKQVQFMGFVPEKNLTSYYRGAEALLVTSLWEGFCLPAVEAMASGCSVVYRKAGALPEIVGDAGYPFATDGEAVRMLKRNKSGNAGIKRSKQYSWIRFARTVYHIITST